MRPVNLQACLHRIHFFTLSAGTIDFRSAGKDAVSCFDHSLASGGTSFSENAVLLMNHVVLKASATSVPRAVLAEILLWNAL